MPTETALPPRHRVTPGEIVKSVPHLPSAPKVLPRLKALLQDGNSALDRIVSMIRLDPGLAAKVLQVGNSLYFFTGARCHTVEDAVARIGYNEIYALVSQAVSMQGLLNRPVVVYRMDADAMWARSVCCAIGSEAIASRVGVDPAAAYTLGLLHGIGMIAIDEWAHNTGTELKLAIHAFPTEATRSERAYFGFTHADVGSCLLEGWDFPEEIADPVRFQYSPGSAASWPALAALLVAARWIRSAVLTPRGHPLPPLPSPAQIRPAGIAVAALTDAIPYVAGRFAAATTLLEEIDHETEVESHSAVAR